MDVHTNFPYKATQRRLRCHALFDYFQGWKIKHLQWLGDPGDRPAPQFAPPKPSVAAALLNAFKAGDELFAQERYQAGIRRAFVTRCQFHDLGIWMKYSRNRLWQDRSRPSVDPDHSC